jgi:hypothetical protein
MNFFDWKYYLNKYPNLVLNGICNEQQALKHWNDHGINERRQSHEYIYISLTSIFQNQDILLKTCESLINQTQLPDNIFIYLSELPYLLDAGFKNKIITNKSLQTFLKKYSNLIIIKWVDNEGPYRKLLPLLKEKWTEDCIIITVDDDTIYDINLIKNMINDYKKYNCVINYRGFTPKCKSLNYFNYHDRDTLINKHLYNFPTGKAGILYKPNFFHKTDNLIFNKNIYMNFCKSQDDVWFYLLRIKNNIFCYIDNKLYMSKDNTNGKCSLYENYNSKDDANTKVLLNTVQHI